MRLNSTVLLLSRCAITRCTLVVTRLTKSVLLKKRLLNLLRFLPSLDAQKRFARLMKPLNLLNLKLLKKMRKLLFLFAVLLCVLCVSSCNVTRRVTTESSYFQHGDTAVTITTRTVESYDATKKLN